MTTTEQQHFERLKNLLVTAERYAPGDEMAVKRLSHLYTLIERLEAALKDSLDAKLVTNYDKLCKAVLSLESAFQLNPGSRFRAKVKPVQEKKKGFDTGMKTK